MHEAYDYLTVRGRSAMPALDGGVLVGAWSGAGGIGWYDDEVTFLIGWPDEAPAARSFEKSAAVDGENLERTVDRLWATARPTSVAPLEPGGVFAHRWFQIDPSDWDEFLSLSTEAWPAFEDAFGATIEALLRSEDGDRVLLITRYPSLAVWEESRGVLRRASDAGRRFLRRRELTRRSIVRTGTLLRP